MKIKITLATIITTLLLQFIRKLEKLTFFLQGKGFGSYSINQEVSLALSKLNKNPDLAIDIGGNLGNYSAELIKKNPNMSIHIFEPTSINIKKLSNRFFSKRNIKINQVAVSDINGRGYIYSDVAGSGLGSLTKRNLDHFNISFNEKEAVETIRFEDYWLKNLNKSNIDLLKIDIEGHELEALRGLGQAINYIKVIQFEFGGCNIDTKTYFQNFFYFFQNHNFSIFRITPLGLQKIEKYSESDEVFLTTNFIAVSNKLKD